MKKLSHYKLTVISIIQYPIIINKINKSNSNIFFFFPSFETGGGEQVHYDIMKSVSDLHPICFITDLPNNDDMKAQYQSVSNLIDLKRWSSKKSFQKKMIKKISEKINSIPNAVVFGSNSQFFYNLLNSLDKHVKVIDLVHTYLADITPYAYENYSLSVINKINYRVVLGHTHSEQLKAFYKRKNIQNSPQTIIINNKVVCPDYIQPKQIKNEFKVLYIGRSTYEKRPELFLEITKQSAIEDLPIKFTMIGDFEDYSVSIGNNVEIIKRIKSKKILNQHYQNADFILITSLYEGFPMVLLEGMALGCIPISTDVGDIPNHINTKNLTGYTIANNQTESQIVDDFVEIIKLLTNDFDLRSKISNNVHNLVKETFSEVVFNKKYRNLLTENISECQQ